MKIIKLTLCNFKNYRGENHFDFSVSPDKNVVLIGGMNGSGKTSIPEAIRLCLYGRKLNGQMINEKKYEAYINDMWTRGEEKKNMQISLDVAVDENIRTTVITVSRTFKKKGDSVEEKLTITQNGRELELIDSSYWEHYLRKLIPIEASRYFFFDGETIRSIITSSDHSDYLLMAVKDLTGISELDVLRDDLLEVKKRITRANSKKEIVKKIEQFEKDVSQQMAEVGTIRYEISLLQAEKGELIKQKNDLDDKFNRALGTKEEKNNKIKKEIEHQKSLYAELNDYVQSYIQSSGHILVCSDLIKKMTEEAKKENDYFAFSFSRERIEERKGAILERIKEICGDPVMYSKIEAIFSEELSGFPEYTGQPILDLTHRQIEVIKGEMLSREFELDEFISQLRKREGVFIEKEKLQKALSKYSDMSLDEFESALQKFNSSISEINGRILEKEIKINTAQQTIQKLRKMISEEEKSLILSTRDKHAIGIVDDVIDKIMIQTALMLSENVDLFESNVNEMYSLLKNKKDMVTNIKIDRDMRIHLRGSSKKSISVEWISEGEKSILMYSIMYGLVKLSKKKMPLIIDSPLGKMDSTHVEKIVSNLYPSLGNQVILLSHDREVTWEVIPLLEPIISRKYLLTENKIKIKEGYFK